MPNNTENEPQFAVMFIDCIGNNKSNNQRMLLWVRIILIGADARYERQPIVYVSRTAIMEVACLMVRITAGAITGSVIECEVVSNWGEGCRSRMGPAPERRESENSLQIPVNRGIRGRIFSHKIPASFRRKAIMAQYYRRKFPAIAGEASVSLAVGIAGVKRNGGEFRNDRATQSKTVTALLATETLAIFAGKYARFCNFREFRDAE